MQDIYINLDDSGKLSNHELLSVYGGIVFFSKKEKDKFITEYRSIIDSIKYKYDSEIKNINIHSGDKRRIMNYIKKYYTIALIIKNNEVYSYIKESKSSKGRFLDYSVRRLIKDMIKCLIKNKIINPKEDIIITLNIDEQSTKNNGYYNLKDGLLEELKYGVTNYNYARVFSPLIKGNLFIKLHYQDSKKSYQVQAADLLAGTIRKISLDTSLDNDDILNSLGKIIDFKKILP